jgi:hypothetical protein
MSGQDLSAPLGPLPPMKIHCAQLVEGALKDALTPGGKPSPMAAPAAPTLFDQLNAPKTVKITLKS